jgi:hypothetical protein
LNLQIIAVVDFFERADIEIVFLKFDVVFVFKNINVVEIVDYYVQFVFCFVERVLKNFQAIFVVRKIAQ